MSNSIFYYKIDENRVPVSGSLQRFSQEPKNGIWIPLPPEVCCSQLEPKAATFSGTASTADSALVSLGCSGSTLAKVTVPLTAGNTTTQKVAAIAAAARSAFAPFGVVITTSGNTISARGLKCSGAVTFTTAYSTSTP